MRKNRQLITILFLSSLLQLPTAMAENCPPKITAVQLVRQPIYRGVDIEVIPEADDQDGDPVSFRYRWFINGRELADSNSPRLPGQLYFKGDRVSLWLTPQDEYAAGPVFYGAEIEIPNAPPNFTSTPPQRIDSAEFNYTPMAMDPDGGPVTYALETAPAGMRIDQATGRISWKISAEDSREQRVVVVARDSEDASAVQEFILKLTRTGE